MVWKADSACIRPLVYRLFLCLRRCHAPFLTPGPAGVALFALTNVAVPKLHQTMGFDDLLDFDASSYAAKMRGLSTPELKAREEEKARQFLSGSCSLGIGAGALAATGGISALWMGFSARNMDVAYKKLGIIQVEFTRRGVPLKDGVNEADKKVAVVGGLTSFLVGGAVQEGLGDGGMAEGATPSFGEVAPANFAAGFAGGVSRDFMERFDTKEWREDIRRALGCKRLAGIWPGAHTVFCDPCGENIEEGLFAREWLASLSVLDG